MVSTKGGRADRLTTQLMSLMDSRQVTVVGVTSHSQEVDASCRRPGRFEPEISLKAPDGGQRQGMLSVLCERLGVHLTEEVARQVQASTAGYLASDLALLVSRLARLDSPDPDTVETAVLAARPASLRTGLGS